MESPEIDHMYYIFTMDVFFLLGGAVMAVVLLVASVGTGLFKKKSLLIVHIVVICDLLFFVLGIVFLGNLVRNYDGILTNNNPYFVIISSAPIVVFFKGSLVLQIGIGLDRLLAIFAPKCYTGTKHSRRAIIYSVFAILMGISDVALMFFMSRFEENPGCASLLCFIDKDFRKLWTLSNGLLGAINCILTLILIARLFVWKVGVKDAERSGEEKLTNVNYIAMTTLFFSGIFVAAPGFFIACYEMSSQDMVSVAPVYYTTLLIHGWSTSTGLILNRDFNQRLRDCYQVIPFLKPRIASPPTTSWNRNNQRVHPVNVKQPSRY